MKKLICRTLFIITVSALFFGCGSTPKYVPEDLTAQEMIQKGQDYFEAGKYQHALLYYTTVTERYTDSLPVYVEASYEIGHLYMKMKKYDLARPIFLDILSIYSRITPGEIPTAYQKLSQLELDKIK